MDKAVCGYLADAYRKLDHEEFSLTTLAASHGGMNVSGWVSTIERQARLLKSLCINGFENPEAYLTNPSTSIFWAEAEVVFNQSMNQERYGPESGPVSIARPFLFDLEFQSKRDSVLIADLLPELVELNQFDLQMQAVLRRKWISIDSLMDHYFPDGREDRCPVPAW